MDKQSRGFTLIELMTVVIVFAILAAIAIASIGKVRKSTAIEDFSGAVKNAMIQARGRSLRSDGRPVLVVVDERTVQWCQVDNTRVRQCPDDPQFGSRVVTARQGVVVEGWRSDVDQSGLGDHKKLPARVYFIIGGRMDTTPDSPETLDGVSIYFQGDPNPIEQRKLTIYPFSGKPRVTDRW